MRHRTGRPQSSPLAPPCPSSSSVSNSSRSDCAQCRKPKPTAAQKRPRCQDHGSRRLESRVESGAAVTRPDASTGSVATGSAKQWFFPIIPSRNPCSFHSRIACGAPACRWQKPAQGGTVIVDAAAAAAAIVALVAGPVYYTAGQINQAGAAATRLGCGDGPGAASRCGDSPWCARTVSTRRRSAPARRAGAACKPRRRAPPAATAPSRRSVAQEECTAQPPHTQLPCGMFC